MAKKKYSVYVKVEDYRNDMSRDRYSATTMLFELLQKVRIFSFSFFFIFVLVNEVNSLMTSSKRKNILAFFFHFYFRFVNAFINSSVHFELLIGKKKNKAL